MSYHNFNNCSLELLVQDCIKCYCIQGTIQTVKVLFARITNALLRLDGWDFLYATGIWGLVEEPVSKLLRPGYFHPVSNLKKGFLYFINLILTLFSDSPPMCCAPTKQAFLCLWHARENTICLWHASLNSYKRNTWTLNSCTWCEFVWGEKHPVDLWRGGIQTLCCCPEVF